MNIVNILLFIIILVLLAYCGYLKLHRQPEDNEATPYAGLHIQVSSNDIMQYIRDTIEPLKSFIESKQIDISIRCIPESMMGWIDTDMMDKIILLLLSDLIKNMEAGNKIAIEVSANQNYDKITIRFDDDAPQMSDASFFIVQHLVGIHHGTMKKVFWEHQGNMILLEFPIKKSVYQEESAEQTASNVPGQSSAFHIPNNIPLNIPTIELPAGYNSGNEPIGRLIQQAYESSDQNFLQRAVNCVKEHIDDSEYDREAFAADMGASPSTLYNKLRAITGKNITAFIRDIRIRTACQLAKERPDLRVSDIAYRVGFKDPKYFATTFKKETGYQPKDYFDKLRAKS